MTFCGFHRKSRGRGAWAITKGGRIQSLRTLHTGSVGRMAPPSFWAPCSCLKEACVSHERDQGILSSRFYLLSLRLNSKPLEPAVPKATLSSDVNLEVIFLDSTLSNRRGGGGGRGRGGSDDNKITNQNQVQNQRDKSPKPVLSELNFQTYYALKCDI